MHSSTTPSNSPAHVLGDAPRAIAQGAEDTGGAGGVIKKVREKKHTPRRIVNAEGGEGIVALSRAEYREKVTSKNRFVGPKAWPLIAKRLYFEFFFRALMDRGAVLSFFTLLTAIPTLTAFYSITTLVLDQNRKQVTDLTDQFIDENVPETFADNARTIVDVIIGSTQQSVVTLTVSVIIALFSSSAYVRAFSRSANGLYGRREGRNIVRTWLAMWGLTFLLVLGLVLVAVAFFFRGDLLTPLFDRFAEPLHLKWLERFIVQDFLPIWGYLRWPVIAILSTFLIAALYHVAPNVSYGRFRWLTVGSVFAFIGIILVALVVKLYLNGFLHFGMYGALGGLIAGFLGLIVANTLLLMGLKLDAEITRARELQAGLDSSEVIQAPPTSDESVDGFNRLQDSLRQDARRFLEH